MLGENHALLSDFPEYEETIRTLTENDQSFSEKAKQYHLLDGQIRKLELRNSPVSDDNMLQLKHERSILKDFLYQKMLNG
ncbi:YdcH family protein [Psychromonas sp. MME2]|uniref:YdcH family protein n=1 Tax=unclassified Psychromonas TaxID=2614957 RepID=UPI00339C71AF